MKKNPSRYERRLAQRELNRKDGKQRDFKAKKVTRRQAAVYR